MNETKLHKIIALIKANTPRKHYLDALFGPAQKSLRAAIASIVHDKVVKPSHRETQYFNLRTELWKLAGCKTACIAAMDDEFNTIANTAYDKVQNGV